MSRFQVSGIAVANYDTALARLSTVPTRSDDILVTTTEYNDDGEPYKTIDPADKEDRTEFDDAGRVTKQIENYTDGDPTTGGNEEDITVEFTYAADGQQATITAKQKSSSDDQTTKYVYGTSLSDSDIARSDLLRAVIYPDSDDSGIGVPPVFSNGPDETYDRVEHKYNRQGEVTETKDQNETVHVFEFDRLGRQTHDRVTTLGTKIDGAVRRISTTYEVRGQIEKITSYDNATVGSGSVVNEVLREYNDLGLLDKEYQEHDGAKDANTLYVGYNYDESVSSGEFTKGLRPKSIRYPNGRLVHYTYGSSGTDADSLNRLDAIKDDNSGSPGSTLASYTYLGLGQMVIKDLEEPDVELDYFGGSSGTYAGLDRFDRIIDQRWHDHAASEDRDRFKYGYGRASNRTWKENVVSKNLAPPVYLDEFYSYDGVNRLTKMNRGQLNTGKSAIQGTPSREEDWMLAPLGNWSNYVKKTSGSTDLNQDRTVNRANEITDITETSGTSWPSPYYDAAGNMTSIPQPSAPSNSFDLTWDAWNRLVKVNDDTTTIAEHAYDAFGRRVTKTINFTVRHFLYSSSWQVLEERLGSSNDPDRQFLWGIRYIDELILRDRAVSAGTLSERFYAIQDGNWNVTGVVDTTGRVQERYEYDPYGINTTLAPNFTIRATSDFAWETTFCGYRWDANTDLFSVRHRFYHTRLGKWLSRDPIQYQSGLNLLQYVAGEPINSVDPTGLVGGWGSAGTTIDGHPINPFTGKALSQSVQRQWEEEALTKRIRDLMTAGGGQARISFGRGWQNMELVTGLPQFSSWNPFATDPIRHGLWSQGCVGVTGCWLGHALKMGTATGDFKDCYVSLAQARARQAKLNASNACKANKTVCGRQARARIFAFRWNEGTSQLPPGGSPRTTDPDTGRVSWNDAVPDRAAPGPVFDFGYFDENLNAFWHALYSEGTHQTSSGPVTSVIKVSTPARFYGPGNVGVQSVVYCVTCQSDEILDLRK